jgi:hypothetical protein
MTCDHVHVSDANETDGVSRRTFMHAAGASAAVLILGPGVQATPTMIDAGMRAPPRNRAPLAAQPYYLLPTGSITPAGWLRRQIEIQAAGLGGHLDEVWEDVGPKSGWLGGDGESWERGPYFLDGLVPLAWALDSAPLKAKAQKFIDWTLSNPQPDGMIGPKSNSDWWPRIVMLKVLTQYHDLTNDPRVVPVMTRYFHYQLQELVKRPLNEWGRFRWQDELLSVLWLYNRTADPRLLELAHLLKTQSADWGAFYANFPFHDKLEMGHFYALEEKKDQDTPMYSHGVNNAMGLKASAVWSLVSDSEADRRAIHEQLATLDQYHGLPIGIFSADEHFAGRNPSQGVELCTVVEAMYSLEHALAITGDVALADRIERIAFNALPAALTDDMWAHQYDQQPNQIECSLKPGPWGTNGPSANLFGLAAYFGCCTANFHQGWPKLAASLWMAASEGGLAAMIYAPCVVTTRVRDVTVQLHEMTDYPFRDQVSVTVEPERPVAFPLKLRVPGWARSAQVKVKGSALSSKPEKDFLVVDRTWHKGDRVELVFDFETRKVRGFNQSVSIEHGSLLFSLPIEEKWNKLVGYGSSAANWEVLPTSVWNYAIKENSALRRSEGAPVSEVPFSSKSSSVTVTVDAEAVPDWATGRQSVPEWATDKNYAPPPPQSPVSLANGVTQTLTLIPYGAAKLRITSFPTVKS